MPLEIYAVNFSSEGLHENSPPVSRVPHYIQDLSTKQQELTLATLKRKKIIGSVLAGS